MTNCETCNGTGYVNIGRPPKRFICGNCHGRGTIPAHSYVYFPTITFKRMEEQRSKNVKRNSLRY